MYVNKETYLMIASDILSTGLAGIKQDIQSFKQKYKGQNYDCIYTSNTSNIFVPRQYIKDWLLNKFISATGNVYLFYTGIGRRSGNLTIAIQQKPYQYELSLQDIIKILKQSKKQNKELAHLYIFIDSCFSGSWCHQLVPTEYVKQISIFASCGKDQVSNDIKGGGLFFQCLFGQNIDHVQQNIHLLFHQQHPIFINGSSPSPSPSPLTLNNIKLLNQNITNISLIIENNNSKQSVKKQQQKQKKKNKQKQEAEEVESISESEALESESEQEIKKKQKMKKQKVKKNKKEYKQKQIRNKIPKRNRKYTTNKRAKKINKSQTQNNKQEK